MLISSEAQTFMFPSYNKKAFWHLYKWKYSERHFVSFLCAEYYLSPVKDQLKKENLSTWLIIYECTNCPDIVLLHSAYTQLKFSSSGDLTLYFVLTSSALSCCNVPVQHSSGMWLLHWTHSYWEKKGKRIRIWKLVSLTTIHF